MWGAIASALVTAFGDLFVKQAELVPGDKRRRPKRLTPIGYLVLLAALTVALSLFVERQSRASADELAWRASVNKSMEAAPKVLQRVDNLERETASVRESMDRHELYLRALLVGQGKDPDRVARRGRTERLGASEGDAD
jgi:hypothetical protein